MLLKSDTPVTRFRKAALKLRMWITGVIVIACSVAAQAGLETEKAFEAAYYREVVAGDPAGAIGQYRAVIEESTADRATGAKALL